MADSHCAINNRVLFIGAGAVNFGGLIGPWNHSRRLEQLGKVQVVAIADPDLAKAQKILENKLSGPFADMYKDCIVMANYLDALKTAKPNMAYIGQCCIDSSPVLRKKGRVWGKCSAGHV